MNQTPIEWCRTYAADGTFVEGHTVNPIRFRPTGASRTVTMCQKVSPGCTHCYAEGITRRFWPKDASAKFPGYTALGVVSGEFVLAESQLLSVLRHKKPTRIFWGDMTDLFQESVPDAFLDRCMAVCALTPHITHMFLTKRPERMRDYMKKMLTRAYIGRLATIAERLRPGGPHTPEWLRHYAYQPAHDVLPPIPNVWLGVSVEDEDAAYKRVHLLVETPAAVRFLSVEPLLGAVNLLPWLLAERWIYLPSSSTPQPDDYHRCIDWVIVGGESGNGTRVRPMHPDWVRSLRDQCIKAEVPFFFKQWGAFAQSTEPVEGFSRVTGNFETVPAKDAFMRIGKKAAGNLLDGKQWHQFPEGTA